MRIPFQLQTPSHTLLRTPAHCSCTEGEVTKPPAKHGQAVCCGHAAFIQLKEKNRLWSEPYKNPYSKELLFILGPLQRSTPLWTCSVNYKHVLIFHQNCNTFGVRTDFSDPVNI